MTDHNTDHNPPDPNASEKDAAALKDLDVSEADAEKVKGGAARTGDPCDGGEIRRR